jgi:ATP-dependent protease ClpP protease subunit
MKEYLTNIYVKHNTTGKDYNVLSADMERDFFMSAQEAVDYGLADKIIDKRGSGNHKNTNPRCLSTKDTQIKAN